MFGLRVVPAVALVASFATVTFAREARADEKAELAAESTFAEGTRLMKADRCDEAVTKFRESQRLDPASGTMLNIAYCEAKLGRVASAWLAYRQAHRLAQSQGKPQHETLAREQADKLEPEVPQLVLVLGRDQPAGVVLKLDGAPLEREMWSVPIPIDPGTHRVERIAEGVEPWQKSVTLARREHISVDVPAVASVAMPPVATPPPTVPPRAEPRPEPAHPPEKASDSSQRTWGYVVGGAGVAAFVTGAALFVSARVQYDGAEDDCQNGCNDAGFEARESARTRGFIAYGVAGAGLVLTGVGLALVLTANDEPGGVDKSALVVGSPTTPWALGWRASY